MAGDIPLRAARDRHHRPHGPLHPSGAPARIRIRTGVGPAVRLVQHVRPPRRGHPDRRGFQGERAVLAGYLRDQRLTLELKCAGSTRRPSRGARWNRPTCPSWVSYATSRGSSSTGSGRSWRARTYAATTARRKTPRASSPAPWPTRRWSRTHGRPGGPRSPSRNNSSRRPPAWTSRGRRGSGGRGRRADGIREVLVHMIEEYARHNGHADFLRERIDGRVGQ